MYFYRTIIDRPPRAIDSSFEESIFVTRRDFNALLTDLLLRPVGAKECLSWIIKVVEMVRAPVVGCGFAGFGSIGRLGLEIV